ncbi:GIY-YIG nuclease family protein [Lacrimispora sp. AGF001]|uniref:GIY-YIG nuclease family protein n=1 Tax=Lacrimispora sp. AGF001 TaxID=3401631 RepID=UPI003B433A5A|nr:GIY-YIG nuclease family protein [Paenibacillaceae bacterium]
MESSAKKALKDQYKNRIMTGGIYRIQCSKDGSYWLRTSLDMQGSKNRFAFSKSTDSCPEICMLKTWKQYGADSFSFEIVEEIEKKETQTQRQFSDDLNTLLELWNEKRMEGEQGT